MPDGPIEGCSGRRRQRPRPFEVHCDGGSVHAAPLAASYKAEIDAVLEQRQRDGPPRVDSDVASNSSSTDRDAHADVFGRPPPGVARMEERLIALESAVGRLPESESGALRLAIRRQPLLFVNCPHTKLILEREDEEGGGHFDAEAAARRLARYWESRRSMLGEEICYGPGACAVPFLDDYTQFYERNLTVLDHPDADEFARKDAERMVDTINMRKVEALETILDQMEGDARKELVEGEVDVSKVLARTMALTCPRVLKVQFLQVENMVERRAAQRLVNYCDTGLELFGPALEQRGAVKLRDLDDCSTLLELGLFRLMPFEDDFGRSILVFRKIFAEEGEEDSSLHISEERLLQLHIDDDHFAKVAWYFGHAALERVGCQRNGLVVIMDLRGATQRSSTNIKAKRRAIKRVTHCLPVNVRALHCVVGHRTSWWRSILGELASVAFRRRFVVHAGTAEENLDVFGESFGIKPDNLPDDLGGTLSREYFLKWLQDRRTAGV